MSKEGSIQPLSTAVVLPALPSGHDRKPDAPPLVSLPVIPPVPLPAVPPEQKQDAPSSLSFTEMVNYEELDKALALKGMRLTKAEEDRIKVIAQPILGENDGGAVIGNSLGTGIMGLVYEFVALFQNIFRGFDIHHIGDSLSNAFTQAHEKTSLNALEQATMKMYMSLKAEGGNLAAAAELVTGQSDHGKPQDMSASIYRQIRVHINQPWGTSASLNHPEQEPHYVSIDPLPPLPTPSQGTDPLLTRGGRTS